MAHRERMRAIIVRPLHGGEIWHALSQKPERSGNLARVELFLAKHVILKSVYQLTRPDLVAYGFLVPWVESRRHP
jgi:hypothetical protein